MNLDEIDAERRLAENKKDLVRARQEYLIHKGVFTTFWRGVQIFVLVLLFWFSEKILLYNVDKMLPEMLDIEVGINDPILTLSLAVYVIFLSALPLVLAKLTMDIIDNVQDDIKQLKESRPLPSKFDDQDDDQADKTGAGQ